MEVTPGYKQSEVGAIPEDWEIAPLGRLLSISAGRDLVKTSFSQEEDDKYKYPIFSNALSNRGLYGFSKDYQYEGDKVTVTARGDVGHATYRCTRFNAIGRLLVLAAREPCDLQYLAEYINNFVEFALESTGVPQLTAPQISQYAVALPPNKAEQTDIAQVLGDADVLIEACPSSYKLEQSPA